MKLNTYELAEIFIKLGWNTEELDFIKTKDGKRNKKAQKIKRAMEKILEERSKE